MTIVFSDVWLDDTKTLRRLEARSPEITRDHPRWTRD